MIYHLWNTIMFNVFDQFNDWFWMIFDATLVSREPGGAACAGNSTSGAVLVHQNFTERSNNKQTHKTCQDFPFSKNGEYVYKVWCQFYVVFFVNVNLPDYGIGTFGFDSALFHPTTAPTNTGSSSSDKMRNPGETLP